jgi:type IV pilus assembly protein PilM
VDLRKEIKLSDLFKRKPKEPKAEQPKAEQPKAEKPKKADKQRKQKEPKQPRAKRERKPRAPRGGSIRGGKKLVGLKIGASSLAAARVANGDVPEVVQVARGELAPGIVVGGEVREPDALAEALKKFFRENKLPRTGVRLGIASNRIGVRTFDVPGVEDQKQLHNAVRYRAQEALPIPLDEAVLDYHVLSDTVNDEGVRVRRVLLVVAYRELVDRYVAACRKAGIKLAGIDLEGFAALRALRSGTPHPNAAVVVASIGHDRSTLAVSDGTICEFTRVIDWGGQNLNVAIARALDMAPSEAEPIKLSVSLLEPAEGWEGLAADKAVRVRDAITAELQVFARELISSLQFYQGQPGSLGIGEIILSGGTAQLPGIDAELGRLLGVSVRVGDPLGRVKRGKKIGDGQPLGSLAIAIGLGIEEAA